MTDRELLEMAAKAARIDATPYYGPSEEFWGLVVDTTGIEWNPLTEDGDALRLAVKLEMRVNVVGYGIAEAMTEKGALVFENDSTNFDTAASTRRAIVRAAAEIGRAQP